MSETITIPPDALPLVRAGAYDLIEDAADAISAVADTRDREDRPERLQAPFEWLARVRALLDAIGWRASETAKVTVSFAEHGATLCEAVDGIFTVMVDALEEADNATRDMAALRVRVLRDFGKE